MKKIKVKTRNNFKKLQSSKKVHVSSTQWTAFRSIQFLQTKNKFPVAIPAESLPPTPFPANSSTGLTDKCSNLWIFLTMSEFAAPERGWHSAQPEWEAGTEGKEPQGRNGSFAVPLQPLQLTEWVKTRLNRSWAAAVIKEPYRQKSRKIFSGLESNHNSLIFIYLWSSEEWGIYIYIYTVNETCLV